MGLINDNNMSVADIKVDEHLAHDDHGHEHHEQSFIQKYIFTEDHKTIGKQFLLAGIFWAILGGWITEAGKLDSEFYLALVTMHGTIMVFFVLTAGLSGTFSNFLIPLQIGARDMASGFMNMLSFWFFFLASVIMFVSLFLETGPAGGGWTIYPPLSALPQAIQGSGTGMTLWLVPMVFFIASQLLGGINYITTVINLRTEGMSFSRLPLTIWAFFITAVLGLLSFPVLFAAALLKKR